MIFRKKPVVIEAVLWNGIQVSEVTEWIRDALHNDTIMRFGDKVVIKTLEGDMIANPGDYIIKGIKGELYPCKPDIFEQTYEPIKD